MPFLAKKAFLAIVCGNILQNINSFMVCFVKLCNGHLSLSSVDNESFILCSLDCSVCVRWFRK